MIPLVVILVAGVFGFIIFDLLQAGFQRRTPPWNILEVMKGVIIIATSVVIAVEGGLI